MIPQMSIQVKLRLASPYQTTQSPMPSGMKAVEASTGEFLTAAATFVATNTGQLASKPGKLGQSQEICSPFEWHHYQLNRNDLRQNLLKINGGPAGI